MPHWSRRLAIVALTALVGGSLVGSGTQAAGGAARKVRPNVQMSAIACTWFGKHQTKAGFNCPVAPPTDANTIKALAKATATKAQKSRPANLASSAVKFGSNVDATDPSEDLASGQSETAVAALGRYVVSAWNDASGFLVGDATLPQASITGVGFSADGGNTFVEAPLPNANPCQQIDGDPTVVALQAGGGTTYFYVTSLYLPFFGPGCFDPVTGAPTGHFQLGMNVGTVAPAGTSITFGPPIVVADGGDVFTGAFLDKEFATLDRGRGLIATSYTAFGFDPTNFSGQINIALCDASVTPDAPTCSPGTGGASYLAIANSPSSGEELEGAYPAFSNTGDLYVAWNQNWFTNLFLPFNGSTDPFTHQFAAQVPVGCLTLPTTSCGPPSAVSLEPAVKSLDATQISGYSRFVGNDFPRIAFNATTGQVAVVWNEANAHPLGDIALVTANRDLSVINPKIRVNDDDSYALHFLPAVSVDAHGNTNVSWYDRRNASGTTRTDVYAVSINPGNVGGVNSRVTTVATDWLATGSFIDPNFGDYTDNTSEGTTFYVNWSDGRIGVPNSFVASAPTK